MIARRRKLSQIMADAISTAVEFEHGHEVIAKYNTLRALSYMGLVRIPKNGNGSACLTGEGLRIRRHLRVNTVGQVNRLHL